VFGKLATVYAELYSKQDVQATARSIFTPLLTFATFLSYWPLRHRCRLHTALGVVSVKQINHHPPAKQINRPTLPTMDFIPAFFLDVNTKIA